MRGIAGLITAAFSLAMLAPSIALADSAAPVIPDVEVLDETGTSHRFYSDLIKGKTVAINFVYTACASSCPASAALFNGVQHRLRTQPERAVSLLSVSIDPTTDRPAQLQAYAEKFGRGADGRSSPDPSARSIGCWRHLVSLHPTRSITLR
ncbi:MAG: SCO family protein [Nitrospiraceae bacterium]